jgi:hypothetical protein
VVVETVDEHRMDFERWQIPEETARKIAAARAAGGRVVAVGTTSVRTLESAAARPEGFGAGQGARTCSSIRPTNSNVVDALVTNFHLPKSTLIMMISAFAGPRLRAGRLPRGHPRGLPLLQLRRLHAPALIPGVPGGGGASQASMLGSRGEVEGELEKFLRFGRGVLQGPSGEDMEGVAIERGFATGFALFLGAEAAGDDVGGFDGAAARGRRRRLAEEDGRGGGDGAGGVDLLPLASMS